MSVRDGHAGAVARFPLGPTVADMYADLRVDPLLRRLLAHSRELPGTVAGSISLVDAGRLGISPKTVEKHVGAVLRKTGTAGRTAAVVHALDHGWLADLPDENASAHR